MAKKIEWVFDRPPASLVRSGSPQSEQSLKASSGLRGKIVREPGSNSGDQTLNDSLPVEIFYDVIEIFGNDKKEFLDAMDWSNLQKHLKGVSKIQDNDFRVRIHEGLEAIKKPRILCLRVSDYNTNGLSGAEDDEDENFNLFSKATLETHNSSKRQGSFGLGKGVFYMHSQISTVLWSTSVPKVKNGPLKTRIFGRSELVGHDAKNTKWGERGFFGIKEKTAIGERAKSFWPSDKQKLNEKLFLERKPGQGTTILSIAYFDPEEEGDAKVQEVLADLERYIKKWFWPGISKKRNKPSIEVSLRHFENKQLVSNKLINNDGYEQFEEALFGNANSKKLNNPEEISERIIPLSIPEKKANPSPKVNDRGHGPLEVDQSLKMVKKSNDSTLMQKNSIALLRNNLCVVEYKPINFNESADPVFGVLQAGLAQGASQENLFAHNFLRDAEPPLHDNWDYRDRLRLRYLRPYDQAIREFLNAVDSEARNILQQKVNISKSDFSHLSSSFKFGSGGSQVKPKSRIPDVLSTQLINNSWHLQVRVKNLNVDPNKDWATLFKCTYKVKSGANENLNLVLSNITYGAKLDNVIQTRVIAEKTIDEFDLSIEAKCSPLFTPQENENLAIELTVLPQEI